MQSSSNDVVEGGGGKNNNSNNLFRLSICALGICVCYMYYGMIQESLFSRQKIGPSFVLLIQCFTNTIVARVWQTLQQHWFSSTTTTTTTTTSNSSTTKSIIPNQQQQQLLVSLHHPLLALTALCYVSAMVCSNESLHYVSYPTAVLAKSCKLIPTMTMGVLVEHKRYQMVEWLAAFCITLGIIIFNLSRMKKNHSGDDDGEEDDDDSSDARGLILLSISLLMDGFLGSCQGLLKQKTTMSVFWTTAAKKQHDKKSDDDEGKTRKKIINVRAPTAVETMLYVNLYAMMYLIPLTIYNQQMADGLAMLQGTMSSSMDDDHDPNNNDKDDDSHAQHSTLLYGLVILNVTVAIGQIFIFLTITWFSSLVCTTITTTRKFFTILLSIVYFGHHFTIQQWMATGLVFAGLYLGIFGHKLVEVVGVIKLGGGGSTSTTTTDNKKHQLSPTFTTTTISKEQGQEERNTNINNNKKVNTRVKDFNFSTTHFNFNYEEDKIKED